MTEFDNIVVEPYDKSEGNECPLPKLHMSTNQIMKLSRIMSEMTAYVKDNAELMSDKFAKMRRIRSGS